MDSPADFAARLRLALQVIGFSRGRAASALNVDKSLVGRWAAGSVTPGEHNLSRITALIAGKVPGFTMADWQRDFDGFAELLGVDASVAQSALLPPAPVDALPLSWLGEARTETARRGSAYEGFWRTTLPSIIMEGKFFHYHGMICTSGNGLLAVRMGGAGLTFEGWMLPAEGNLFVILYDVVGFTPMFLIFKGVPLPQATRLDGLLLLAALDSQRTPAAVPILLERIGDLSGNAAADEATWVELRGREPLAKPKDVPDSVAAHLLRDFGPAAAAIGGDLFLTASAAKRLSRGATPSGALEG